MIKFLVMDVDGTLTDGKIYMGENGECFKVFDIKDGCGIKDILPTINILPIIITARESKLLEKRCQELGITHIYQNERNKYEKLCNIISKQSDIDKKRYTLKNVAYIGDDILDIQCMIPVRNGGGIVGCPFDAVEEVKNISTFISEKKGGDGAVRDFIEYLRKYQHNEINKNGVLKEQ